MVLHIIAFGRLYLDMFCPVDLETQFEAILYILIMKTCPCNVYPLTPIFIK